MVTPLRQRFFHLSVGWLLAVVTVTSVFGIASLEFIYIVSLVGFHIIIRFVSSVNVRPDWRERLQWLILASLAGLPVIVALRATRVLPERVVEDIDSLISLLIILG